MNKIIRSKYQNGKVYFLLNDRSHWLSKNKVIDLQDGNEAIEEFLKQEDEIESLELIGSQESCGSLAALKEFPRRWVFQVEWKLRGRKYMTYEELLDVAPEKIIDLWEETFQNQPYKKALSQTI